MTTISPSFHCKEPTPEQKEDIDELVNNAHSLKTIIEESPFSRERSIALTRLEEAVMWAKKAVCAEEQPHVEPYSQTHNPS